MGVTTRPGFASGSTSFDTVSETVLDIVLMAVPVVVTRIRHAATGSAHLACRLTFATETTLSSDSSDSPVSSASADADDRGCHKLR